MLFLKSELFPACLLTIVMQAQRIYIYYVPALLLLKDILYIYVFFITYFLLITFHVLFRLKMEAHDIFMK
jgi:hypothetical protein